MEPEEVDLAAGLAAEDAVVEEELDGLLTIDGEEGFVGDDVDDDGDLAVAGEDDGADGEEVGADGGEDHGVDCGHEDGAVGGEGVGGGAGGGGDDDAVGAEAGDELAVELDGEFTHAGDGTFGEDDVVECVPFAEEVAVAEELGAHEAAGVDDGGTGDPGFEGGVELGEGDFGEEAERAEVDAEDGGVRVGKGASDGEKGAIATQRDGNGGLVIRHIVALDGLIVAMEVEGALRVKDRDEALSVEPEDELGEDEFELWLLRLGDDGSLGHGDECIARHELSGVGFAFA